MTRAREPFQQVRITQKRCANVYGTAPCTAVVGITGPERCFNTLASCQDRSNYIATDHVLTYCKQNENMPRSADAGIPSVTSVTTLPATLNIAAASVDQGPLGRRGAVKITFADHPFHDRDTDPYWQTRTYNARDVSTYWAKWLVRNPYHEGWGIEIVDSDLTGQLATRTRHFVIDRIDFTSNGACTITAKDILAPVDKALAPAASKGVTTTAIVSASPEFILDGDGDDYPFGTSVYRIDDELILGTRVNHFPNVNIDVRGYGGTEIKDHDANQKVQAAVEVSGRVDVVLYQLLVTYGGVDAAFIDTSAWAAEASKWCSAFTVSSIISDPTAVSKLIGELLEQCSCVIWWSEIQQAVRFRAVRPIDPAIETITGLNDSANIKMGSVAIKAMPEQRIDEVWFYYGLKSYTADVTKPSNYSRIRVTVATQQQADYGTGPHVRQIFSRWLIEGALGAVITTSTRILQRLALTPRDISFALDAKDRDIWVGDVVQLTTRSLIDMSGAQLPTLLQITSAEEKVNGHEVQYIASYFGLSQRSAFITPNDYPVYSLATADQRTNGCFISDNTGHIPGGDPGYLLS